MVDLGPIGQKIKHKLEGQLRPAFLEVLDESSQHAGHAGSHPHGESHFRIRIKAEGLAGLSRVNQHRQINAVLADELRTRVHALAIEIL
jgi:BolA protein